MTKPKPNITCEHHTADPTKFCKHIMTPDQEGDKCLCAHPELSLCTETLKWEPSRVSHSAIADHMRCPKLDWYKNICGLEPVEQLASDAIKMGNVWEARLEYLHGIQNIAKLNATYMNNPLPDKERAIIMALERAMTDMKLSIPSGKWQVKDGTLLEDSDGIKHPVSFVFDVLHEDSFSEIKLASQFRYYDNAWELEDQGGLYLALNPHLKYFTMYVVLKPDLKLLKQNKTNPRDETIEEYERRVYNAVIGDGRRYFLDMRGTLGDGTRTWGRRFDRAQFDMDELRLKAVEISKERQWRMLRNQWRMDKGGCYKYGKDYPCEFLSVCKNQGRVSDRFRVKETIIEPQEVASENNQ